VESLQSKFGSIDSAQLLLTPGWEHQSECG
jgi:hypothetical protein